MKNKSPYVLIFLSFCFLSCTSEDTSTDLSVRTVAVESDRIEQLVSTAFLNQVSLVSVTYPADVHFGRINVVKKSGEYLVALSWNTNSLLCFKGNKFLYHLDRQGQGPGEFDSLYTFAIDTLNQELVAYDRGLMKLMHVDLESGSFKKEETFQQWVSNLEDFDATRWLVSTDVGDEAYMYLIDKTNLSRKTSLLSTTFPLITDAVSATGISRNDSGFYYFEPFTNNLYLIKDQKAVPQLTIDFGKNTFPESLWKLSDTEEVERRLGSGTYSFVCQLFTKTASGFYFFHYYTTERMRLVKIDETGNTQAQCEVSIDEVLSKALPMPQTSDNGVFARLFHSDELTEQQSFMGHPVPVHPENQNSLVLLTYTLK